MLLDLCCRWFWRPQRSGPQAIAVVRDIFKRQESCSGQDSRFLRIVWPAWAEVDVYNFRFPVKSSLAKPPARFIGKLCRPRTLDVDAVDFGVAVRRGKPRHLGPDVDALADRLAERPRPVIRSGRREQVARL